MIINFIFASIGFALGYITSSVLLFNKISELESDIKQLKMVLNSKLIKEGY